MLVAVKSFLKNKKRINLLYFLILYKAGWYIFHVNVLSM